MRVPLAGKIKSAVWFLKRPQLYPQFLHLLKVRLLSRPEADTRAQSETWCESIAISADEAITRITGSPKGEPIESKFSKLFLEAREQVNRVPHVMGGPGALDLLYWVALRLKAERIVETGVACGWSSLTLLLALEEQTKGRLISTDMPYVRAESDDIVGIAVPKRLHARWKLIRRADRQALPAALRELGTIDLCHYDSDKSYLGRMWAYPRLWAALRPGGCFISDDIDDNLGFRDFARSVGAEPIVLRFKEGAPTKHVGVLVKKS